MIRKVVKCMVKDLSLQKVSFYLALLLVYTFPFKEGLLIYS